MPLDDYLQPTDTTPIQLAFEAYVESEIADTDFTDWIADELPDEIADELVPRELLLALRDHWKTTSSFERGFNSWIMRDEEDD